MIFCPALRQLRVVFSRDTWVRNYYVHVHSKASLAEFPKAQATIAGQNSRFFTDPTNERPIVAVRQLTPEEVQAIRAAEPVVLPAEINHPLDEEDVPLIDRAPASPRL